MEQSVEDNSNSDLGFSPSDRGTSSVGSTEGAPFTVVVDGASESGTSLEENFSTTAQHGSVDQEPSTLAVEFADEQEELDDESQFQDAPDQLSIMSDGRSVDNGESTVFVEPQEGPEENLDFQVVEDGKEVRQLTYELALLQASLEKTTWDKEFMAQKHKEEREMLGRELANLHRQLETMANQQLFLTDNANSLVDRLRQEEEEEYMEGETHVSDASLHLMITDCSKPLELLKRTLDEQLQSEGTIRELHAVLFTKDQEIENLSAKVNELSVSHDVIVSHMDSLQQTLSQSLQESSDHKRMEDDFIEKLNRVENKNKQLLEQLEKANGEVRKIKVEMEQEKNKSATTKEKLGMAVTKGKALVQQRDLLKQSLLEKTNELEKCLSELQEKSTALDSTAIQNEELIKSKSLSASLQESLSKKATALEEIEEFLSRTDMPNGHHSMDIIEYVRWLADQKNELVTVSLEQNQLKSLLLSFNLPEVVASSKMESQISWLGESLSLAEDNIIKLQGEFITSKVAIASLESELAEAFDELDKLKTSLSTEQREKESLQMELEDLMSKYEEVVEREFQVTSTKDRMTRMFLEACGVEDQGELREPYSDTAMFIDKCVGKLKAQITAHSESTHTGKEQFQRLQSLLYVRDQEAVLCKDMLDDEMLNRSEIATIEDELKRVSEEVMALKDEKDSLQKDLERSDEKTALLREKLSMAVKKGKGLVQDREGLKKSVDEKNTEIERLKLELLQQEAVVSGCRDQINGLTNDLGRLSKLEFDLLGMKDQKEQLEKYLVESNSMLERVVESMESVVLPVDTVLEEPVDKVRWLADCFNEYQIGKVNAEQELQKLKEELDSLSGKLTEAVATIRSLEDALAEAEKSISHLGEERKVMQADKTYLEQELEKEKEEASIHGSKIAEACANIKSLEVALSQAEKNTTILEEEKAAAFLDKNIAEKELEKAKEEADHHGNKLAEAHATIESLEERLSQLDKSVSILTEEKSVAQAGMTSLERELEKAKEEAGSQGSKLVDVYATVKSLEDALSAAEDNISLLTSRKENAEMEVQASNAKLSASMAELAGTHGSLESQSLELFGHLNRLQVIMNDENLLSALTQDFKRKFEGLRDMSVLLENIRDQFVEQGSEQLQTNVTKKDTHAAKVVFSAHIDKFLNGTVQNIETNVTHHDDILAYSAGIVEGFNKKNKFLKDKFEGFSSSMDELIAILMRALQATRENVIVVLEPMDTLKLDVKNLAVYKQAVEGSIFTLKNDINMLLSSWFDAAEDLGFQMDNCLVDGLYVGTTYANEDAMEKQRQRLGGSEYVDAAEDLAKEVQSLVKKLENVKKFTLKTIEELHIRMKDAQLVSQNAITERDLNQERIATLERDLDALQEFCNEMRIKVKDGEAEEDMLREKDAELSKLRHSLATKEQETASYMLSEGQVKTLFEKIDQIEILSEESELHKSESRYSGPAEKLFVIVDSVTHLQQQMKLLSHDNEELQSSLAIQTDEIERLKNEAGSLRNINEDLGRTKSDINELAMDLERLIQKFGGNDLVDDKKFGVKGLLTMLENLVMVSTRECETSKLEAQESGVRLLENQKVVDELLEKIKLLEDTIHSKSAPIDPVQERSMFKEPSLPAGSEISEIEDAAPLGRNSLSPVPPAAHVRTLRKGSSDHLAITIDSESDRLINRHETDDDKGHAFKSLNTSSLIPKQGKLIADRIDGIWVSGGRLLMSRPRARIGIIAYSLLLHLWLLGTLL